MYAPYRPPAGLVELPAGAGGSVPPYVLVRDDRAVQVLAGWCGADLAAYAKGRAGGAAPPGGTAPAAIMPTAELAGEFATLVLLRVALAEGQRVLVRTLVVATTGEGRHWLLDGEWWERSLPASVDDLGQRIAAMLRVPGSGALG